MSWIAFTMGLMGSLHCLGMCGPIALSIPVAGSSQSKRLMTVLVYNIGRILVYACMGLIAGTIGKTVAMAGFQQGLSIAAGIMILVMLFTPLSKQLSSVSFFGKLKDKYHFLIKRRTYTSTFMLGALNGLLPCGMVYVALAAAAATGGFGSGALFMAAFGAGTFPIMASITYTSSLFTQGFRNSLRKSVPYMMGFVAVLLVLRGMNLDIPYISPKASSTNEVHACCHSSKNSCKK